jgi:hypothetical protein
MSDPRKLIEEARGRTIQGFFEKIDDLADALERALEERDEYAKADERSFRIIGALTERAEAAEAEVRRLGLLADEVKT